MKTAKRVAGGVATVVEPGGGVGFEATGIPSGDELLERSVFEQCRQKAEQQRISHRQAITQLYGPGGARDKLLARLERECTDPTHALVKKPIDPEVEEFREGFDAGESVAGVVKGLGDTPNAFVGAAVDAAKSKHEAETRAKGNGKKAAFSPLVTAAELFQSTSCFLIPLSSILAAPDNARKTFDAAKLEGLAADMKKHGQHTPCKVRPTGAGHYTLIDGERRYRAAKRARLSSLRCEVVEVTEEEAREQALVINLQREDLNPIERAIGFKQLLDDGRTQQGLAELLGVSQPEVSNTVRMLKLPPDVQAKVAEGLLSTTHATALIAACKEPRFAAGFLKLAKEDKWELGPISNFHTYIAAVYFDSFPVVFNCRNEHGVDEAKLAKAHATELALIPFKNHGSDRLAVGNAPRWKELLAEAKQRVAGKRDKDDGRQTAEAAKLSPAEQKKRAHELAEQQARRVERWYIAWLQARIVEWLDDRAKFDQATLNRLTLHFCIRGAKWGTAAEDLADVLKEADVRPKRGAHGFDLLAALGPKEVIGMGHALLAKWLAVPVDHYSARINADDVRNIGREMKIDVGQEWTLTEDFLQLFNKTQLGALAIEEGFDGTHKLRAAFDGAKVFEKQKRSEAIALLLDWSKERRLPTPAMLLELAKGKD